MEPWRTKLTEGDVEAAWGQFIDRYRRLILVTIRRTVNHDERVMDAFAHVCGQLSANRLARLTRYEPRPRPWARFSTWLVTVVHNLTIDWLRRQNGRPRARAPAELSDFQEQIFRHVFVEGYTHAETYELVGASPVGKRTFGAFLKELAEVYRSVERGRPRGLMRYFAGHDPAAVTEAGGESRLVRAEVRTSLAEALASLPSDERLGVQLYVVEELPAADVARTLGWPNAKAVYNRVYRALTRLRATLAREGVAPEDLLSD